MTVSAPDRLQRLLDDGQRAVTGIDFVEVADDARTLHVHLLKPWSQLDPPAAAPTNDDVEIFREEADGTRVDVPLGPAAPALDGAAAVLDVTAAHTADFARYRLRILHPRFDRFFSEAEISFRAFCPTDVDCAERERACPAEPAESFPIEYRARDFWSFRRALVEFAAQRHPEWQDRGREADVGMMWAELASALGDELAYYQDRVAREAHLETATQRRSVRRHARLVDYELHDGLVAHGWLDVTVHDGRRGAIRAGLGVQATSEFGATIGFEVGRGLEDVLSGRTYPVDSARNRLRPHVWDQRAPCLGVGATELFVRGHHGATLPLQQDGTWVLLRTRPPDPGLPTRDWPVRLVDVVDEDASGAALVDPLAVEGDPAAPIEITRLVWDRAQALPFALDLRALEVRANLVPVVGGRTRHSRFVIGALPEDADLEAAVERAGPDGTVTFLHSLPGTETDGLCWNGPEARSARPEIRLREMGAGDWTWRRSLVGHGSQPRDKDFTLDDGTWGRVVGYRREGNEIVHRDYRTGAGATVRFGDGEFGLVPPRETVFEATYRVGGGRRGNVPAFAISSFEAGGAVVDEAGQVVTAGELLRAVANPLPLESGTDPETLDEARQLAPEAFRAVAFRAVTERDYAEAVERLPWVQRAGAAFRWTGSWLCAFVTPDPVGSVSLTTPRREEAHDQLERLRQAGREVSVLEPRYADLDLEIHVCVEPGSQRDRVRDHVMRRLVGPEAGAGAPFFSPDAFTFGTPLERSALESAIQRVPGVRAVQCIGLARRGYFEKRPFSELVFRVGANEVVRVEHDPARPDRGSVTLVMEGGA